jgi:micrococcal nuclease
MFIALLLLSNSMRPMSTRRKQKILIGVILTLITIFTTDRNHLGIFTDSTKKIHTVSSFVSPAYSSSTVYLVTHVVDGDTIDIESAGKSSRIRLIGINSPESVDPRRPVQCFGKEAAQYAKELLEGNFVSVETDPSQGLYDKYGRILAYIFLSDGSSFNKKMISGGYAYEYTYHAPYEYQKDFKAAQNDAHLNGRGLWASSTCAGMLKNLK